MKYFFTLFTIIYLHAQTQGPDSVSQNHNILVRDQLNLGKTTYLVFMQDEAGNKSFFNLWEREIKKTTNGNYQFDWTVHFSEVGGYYTVKTLLTKDFLPIEETAFYSDKIPRNTKEMRKKFRFLSDRMRSDADTLYHNSAPVEQKYTSIPFDWQLDMETYSQLPFHKSKSFLVNFYHPGSLPPKYHQYDVIGEETIQINGKRRSCWILKTSYTKDGYSQWWIDKSDYKVVKLKEKFNTRYRYKILIDNL